MPRKGGFAARFFSWCDLSTAPLRSKVFAPEGAPDMQKNAVPEIEEEGAMTMKSRKLKRFEAALAALPCWCVKVLLSISRRAPAAR